MEIKFTNYYKEKLKEYMETYLPDIDYDVFDDFEFNSKKDCVVILKGLGGNIANGTLAKAYQLMVRCKDKYKDQLIELFNLIAMDLNETIATVDATKIGENASLLEETTIKIKQIYGLCTLMSNFEDEGLDYYCSLAQNINIMAFNNPLDVEEVRLDDNKVNFIDFGFKFTTTTAASGALNHKGRNKNTNKSAIIGFNLSAISSDIFSIIVDDMLNVNDINKVHKLEIDVNNKTYTYNVIITSCDYAKSYNSVSTIALNFAEADVEED